MDDMHQVSIEDRAAMKILITGANGQLGRELSEILESGAAEIGKIDSIYDNAEVMGVDLPDYDLTDEKVVESLFGKFKPDLVFNCAAYTNVDGCEKNEEVAMSGNATLPGVVAEFCARGGSRIVHISTDYVFSGDEPGERVESDNAIPKSAYGRTKQIGEMLVRRNCVQSHVVRTSWLFGKYGKNFVETMLNLAGLREEISVVDDQIGNPTSANDLAYEMTKIASSDDFGIWHCTGNGICSWADFAEKSISLAGLSCKVNRISTEQYKLQNPNAADRPKYSALKNEKLQNTIGDEMRNWHESLVDYIKNRKAS